MSRDGSWDSFRGPERFSRDQSVVSDLADRFQHSFRSGGQGQGNYSLQRELNRQADHPAQQLTRAQLEEAERRWQPQQRRLRQAQPRSRSRSIAPRPRQPSHLSPPPSEIDCSENEERQPHRGVRNTSSSSHDRHEFRSLSQQSRVNERVQRQLPQQRRASSRLTYDDIERAISPRSGSEDEEAMESDQQIIDREMERTSRIGRRLDDRLAGDDTFTDDVGDPDNPARSRRGSRGRGRGGGGGGGDGGPQGEQRFWKASMPCPPPVDLGIRCFTNEEMFGPVAGPCGDLIEFAKIGYNPVLSMVDPNKKFDPTRPWANGAISLDSQDRESSWCNLSPDERESQIELDKQLYQVNSFSQTDNLLTLEFGRFNRKNILIIDPVQGLPMGRRDLYNFMTARADMSMAPEDEKKKQLIIEHRERYVRGEQALMAVSRVIYDLHQRFFMAPQRGNQLWTPASIIRWILNDHRAKLRYDRDRLAKLVDMASNSVIQTSYFNEAPTVDRHTTTAFLGLTNQLEKYNREMRHLKMTN